MDKEIKALRQELALLKLQFSERVRGVEQRLDNLLAKQSVEQAVINKTSSDEIITDETAFNSSSAQTSSVNETTNLANSHIDNSHIDNSITETSATEQATEGSVDLDLTLEQRKSKNQPVYQLDSVELTLPIQEDKPSSKSALNVFISFLLSTLFDWLSPVVNIYQSYKERGMLGIFALTVSGVALTLAGFGYLMELLIDQLGAGSKSMLMALVTVMVIGLGIVLKTKPRFSEFGTAIVGLGLLLSYSTVYFTGSVYGLLPLTIVLGLYFVVALLCHGLALWLNAKVIASLGVMGVALMPMVSSFTTNNEVLMEPSYYLVSLILISMSSLFIAFKRVGLWLAHLTLAFSFIAIEWLISTSMSHADEGALILASSILYGLFFCFSVCVLYKNNHIIPVELSKLVSAHQAGLNAGGDDNADKNDNRVEPTNYAWQMLAFFAASLGVVLAVFFQSFDFASTAVSIAFLVNSLGAAIAGVIFYKLRHGATYVFTSIAVIWGIFSVVSLIGQAQWGIAWAVEGLLLIAMAKKYHLAESINLSRFRLSLINQGQILILVALLYSWFGLSIYFPLPALKSFDGWLLSIVIVIVIALWQRMISENQAMFDPLSREMIKPALQLIEVLWLVVLLIASSVVWLGDYTGALAIIIQVAVLFRAKKCAHTGIELLAICLIVIPLGYVGLGAIAADSLRFTALPLFAQLALVSAFVQLWLWSEFYRRFYKKSSLSSLAEYARIAFYVLVPICWVGSVIRRYDELALLVLWLSPLLALMLAIRIKHVLLAKEFKLVISLASAFFAIAISGLNLVYASLALGLFSGLFYVCFWLNQQDGDLKKELGYFGQKVGLYSLGVAVPVYLGSQLDSALIFGISAALYWAVALYFVTRPSLLQECQKSISVINILIFFVACLLSLSMSEFIVMPALFFIGVLLKRPYPLLAPWPKCKLFEHQDLVIHGFGVISYCCLLIGFSAAPLHLLIAPALAIHGALILFIKDKRVTTLKFGFALILLGIIKLGHALLWQKVMLFMGLGVFILFASFAYQKLLAKASLAHEE